MKQKLDYEGSTRMMDAPKLCAYLSMGRTRAVEFARGIGAEVKIGRRCLYDRNVIDNALDCMKGKE